MRCFFHLFALTLSSLSMPFKPATAGEVKRKEEKLRVSFKVEIPRKMGSPFSTNDEQDYIMMCLASSFNRMAENHDNFVNTTIEEVVVDDKLIMQIPAAISAGLGCSGRHPNWCYDDDYKYNQYWDDYDTTEDDYYWGGNSEKYWDFWYGGYAIGIYGEMPPYCWSYNSWCLRDGRLRPHLLGSPHKNPEWQHDFKECLEESSFKDMKHPFDITIEVIDEGEEHEFEGIQSEIKVSFQVPVDGLTNEEHDFIMQILQDTYNGLKPGGMKQSTITSASLKESGSSLLGEDGKKKVVTPSHLRSNSDGWRIDLTAVVESATVSRFPLAMPLDVKSITDWENTLCAEIAKGSFENLTKISNCKIETKTLPDDKIDTDTVLGSLAEAFE